MLNDILLSNNNDSPPSIRLYTKLWSFFLPNSTFYRIMRRFHRTFAMDVVCRRGWFLLWKPDPVQFGTCIRSTGWDQSFSQTCRLCTSIIPCHFLDFASVYSRDFLDGTGSSFCFIKAKFSAGIYVNHGHILFHRYTMMRSINWCDLTTGTLIPLRQHTLWIPSLKFTTSTPVCYFKTIFNFTPATNNHLK